MKTSHEGEHEQHRREHRPADAERRLLVAHAQVALGEREHELAERPQLAHRPADLIFRRKKISRRGSVGSAAEDLAHLRRVPRSLCGCTSATGSSTEDPSTRWQGRVSRLPPRVEFRLPPPPTYYQRCDDDARRPHGRARERCPGQARGAPAARRSEPRRVPATQRALRRDDPRAGRAPLLRRRASAAQPVPQRRPRPRLGLAPQDVLERATTSSRTSRGARATRSGRASTPTPSSQAHRVRLATARAAPRARARRAAGRDPSAGGRRDPPVTDEQTRTDYLQVVADAWGMGTMPLDMAARVFFDPQSVDVPNVAALRRLLRRPPALRRDDLRHAPGRARLSGSDDPPSEARAAAPAARARPTAARPRARAVSGPR